jgi:hypothetical protein
LYQIFKIIYSFLTLIQNNGCTELLQQSNYKQVCKLFLLFISADAAQEKEKKYKKVLLPTCVSKSAAHAVI